MSGMIAIAAAVAVFTGIGSGIGIALATCKAVDATARQPEAASAIRTTMLLGCALSEAIAVYGLVASILLIFMS